MQSNQAKLIALSGMLAAVAVVIMSLGGLIPIATYVCPMLCTMTQFVVLRFCGKKIGWTWFFVVSILSLLLGPDKEAVFVFLAIGHYPLLKEKIEKHKLHFFFKLVFFNAAILAVYSFMIYLFGMEDVAAENMEFGFIGLAVILLLGNMTFILLDRLLTIIARKLR